MMTEKVRELLEILRDEDNCNVLDYIDDAADLMEHLASDLDRVTKERDAAVGDLRGRCFACAHAKPDNKYPQLNICPYIAAKLGGEGARDCKHWQR